MSPNKTVRTRIIKTTTWFRTRLPPTVMADRPRRVIAWLVLKHGHGRDKFKLGHVNTLGRSNRCEVTLSDELVSGEHARIKFENTQFTLYDLVSTNGTYLNGKLISTSELLVDGDLIRLGNTELVFKRT